MIKDKNSPSIPRGKRGKAKAHKEDMHHSLQETQRALHFAFDAFHHSTEEEMIATYLYEIKALRARESYLLRHLEMASLPSTSPPAPSLEQ